MCINIMVLFACYYYNIDIINIWCYCYYGIIIIIQFKSKICAFLMLKSNENVEKDL